MKERRAGCRFLLLFAVFCLSEGERICSSATAVSLFSCGNGPICCCRFSIDELCPLPIPEWAHQQTSLLLSSCFFPPSLSQTHTKTFQTAFVASSCFLILTFLSLLVPLSLNVFLTELHTKISAEEGIKRKANERRNKSCLLPLCTEVHRCFKQLNSNKNFLSSFFLYPMNSAGLV